MDNLLQPEQWVFKTNLGWMALVLRSKGIERLIFGYDTQSALREHLLQILPVTNIKKNVDHTYVQSLMDYAKGVQVSFKKFQLLPFATTDFQSQVYKKTLAIPYGKSVSYKELATKAKRPNAARAVGNIMSQNLIPIIIPCHRVIASDGSLGGYTSPKGVKLKQRLLDLEKSAL